ISTDWFGVGAENEINKQERRIAYGLTVIPGRLLGLQCKKQLSRNAHRCIVTTPFWKKDILVAIGSYSLSKSYQQEHKQWDKPGNGVGKTTQYDAFSDFLNG